MKVLHIILVLFKKSYILYFKDNDLFEKSEYFNDDDDDNDEDNNNDNNK
jgi:hypothetical protein